MSYSDSDFIIIKNGDFALNIDSDNVISYMKLQDEYDIPSSLCDIIVKNNKNFNVDKQFDNTKFTISGNIKDTFVILEIIFSKCKIHKEAVGAFDGENCFYNKRIANLLTLNRENCRQFELHEEDNHYEQLFKLVTELSDNESEIKILFDAIKILCLKDVNIVLNKDLIKNTTYLDITEFMTINNIECYKTPYAEYGEYNFYEDLCFVFLENNKPKIFLDSLEQEYYMQLCRNEYYKKDIKQLGLTNQTNMRIQNVLYEGNKYMVLVREYSDVVEYYAAYKNISIKLNERYEEHLKIINKIKQKMNVVKELCGN